MVERIGYLIVFLLLFGEMTTVAGEENPSREFSFLIMGNRPDATIYYGEFNKESELIGSIPLVFKTSGRSSRYEYDGTNPVVFFTETPRPSHEDPSAVERKVVGVVDVESEAKELMLVFSEASDSPSRNLRYSITAIDINSRNLPRRHLKVVNLSPVELQGVIGSDAGTSLDEKTTFRIRPGVNPPLRLRNSNRVLIALETERAGWVTAFEEEFAVRDNERYLLVVYPPKVRGSVILRGRVVALRDRSNEPSAKNP